MIKYICDRCGKEKDKDSNFQPREDMDKASIYVNGSELVLNLELCDDCVKELSEWLDSKKEDSLLKVPDEHTFKKLEEYFYCNIYDDAVVRGLYEGCCSEDHGIHAHIFFKHKNVVERMLKYNRLHNYMAYFKDLYEPDFDFDEGYGIFLSTNCPGLEEPEFKVMRGVSSYRIDKILFKSKEVAERCAEWLNKLYKEGKLT